MTGAENRRGRQAWIALLLAALLLSGCAGRRPARAGVAAPTTTATIDGCVRASQAGPVDLGGARAVTLGGGPVGVVLSNQSDQNLCGWLPFARVLAARGFRVLLHDYYGPTPAGDAAQGAAKLRSLGARTVLLVGASQGAKASLLAGVQVRPPVAGVVAVSPERYLQGADMVPVAARLRVPVLYLAARADPYTDDAPAKLYRASAHAPWRRLVVLPGLAHGTALLTGPGAARARDPIVEFLRRYGR
ncbi:MAG TPA: hypothetical protein VFD04_22265 [Actinomycetes bacterium]|jgi:pimeloyl-ACP methyl ester carboxylesterase|nr:hypothetical protein [Actinomycetes bacterium]